MRIAGVDNGFTGAIVFMDMENYRLLEVCDMPVIAVEGKPWLDEVGIRDLLDDWDIEHVYIEKAGAMPGQGIASTGRYLTGYGIIRGICVGLGIPYTLITPQRWKKHQMEGMGKEKGASILRVQQLYPDVKLSRKKDHGKADAILIAREGAQHG